ncbi:unnamed protein product [Allacma fusca]|uniref:WD and tetratricopeptide repeats protein 1 n=1 Tax=Allacma fusca TaxID=39272 RepID=A0A8J2LG36_9HEXA|nr:unnamed protein product [Allacma fusca]
MRSTQNFASLHLKRELDERYRYAIQNEFMVTGENIRKLDLYGELEGHSGCVNCLEWNESGSIVASGSDDVHINLWDPLRKKLLVSIPSGHHGNIFSVKFVPNSRDRQIISGAADHAIRVHDVDVKEILSMCSCHQGRVKRIVTDPNVPHLFWSAGEDGVIIQHDLRTSHYCTTSSKKLKNILINLKSYTGSKAEAKCLAVNPVQPEYMAVGANDAFVRIYDRRMIKLFDESNPQSIPSDAVQYFVPGHLPAKMLEYKRNFRSIASTYVAFSPDGRELLVNLGGEQIYLFPVLSSVQKLPMSFTVPKTNKPAEESVENGGKPSNGYVNGCHSIGQLPFMCKDFRSASVRTLPPHVEAIKLLANEAFEAKKYSRAIHLYNDALLKCPNSPVLLGNRAAALLKRQWDGDVYSALYDCHTALNLDQGHFKAHIRLCRCLHDLGRYCEANSCLRNFQDRFPSHAQSQICRKLEADITRNLKASENTKVSSSSSSSSDSCSPAASTPSPSASGPAGAARSNSTENYSNLQEEDDEVMSENSSETVASNNDAVNENASGEPEKKKKTILFPQDELNFKTRAIDFSGRFCGHCNTTTDIKEANFFGNYIVAGSDDGKFFIWDKNTSNIVRILVGDESIVNCLQPHPSTCLLATSGIESVVRIWSPLPDQDGKNSERVVEDIEDAASTNQKRMASNPAGNFLNLFFNMGYRLNAEQEQVEDAQDAAVQCNST